MQAIDTKTAHGYTATTYPDEGVASPADTGTMVGTVAYDHRQGSYGDLPPDPYGEGPFAVQCEYCSQRTEDDCGVCKGRRVLIDGAWIAREEHGATVCLPVRSWDDRNGTELRIADDWHEATGWIYATAASVAEALGADASEEEIRATLKVELEEWGQWARGEVYGVVVTNPSGEEVDSCWGIYGDADDEAARMLKDATAHLDANPGLARAEAVWFGGAR